MTTTFSFPLFFLLSPFSLFFFFPPLPSGPPGGETRHLTVYGGFFPSPFSIVFSFFPFPSTCVRSVFTVRGGKAGGCPFHLFFFLFLLFPFRFRTSLFPSLPFLAERAWTLARDMREEIIVLRRFGYGLFLPFPLSKPLFFPFSFLPRQRMKARGGIQTVEADGFSFFSFFYFHVIDSSLFPWVST